MTNLKPQSVMKWYNYIASFLAGVFLINTLPHFIHGIDGDSFPTPFSSINEHGLSSPVVNDLWALFNLSVGLLLLAAGKILRVNKWSVILVVGGIAAFSLVLSAMSPTVLAYYRSIHQTHF